ncbi:MAG: CsgG/HfaB family protein [Thermotogota bacterium]|nr:CsgG/HfaB family protein [Thermotogota bacterium]
MKKLIQLKYLCAVMISITCFLFCKVPLVFAERVVFVPPFENLSKFKATSTYRTNTGTESNPTRTFTIDRYSEIPRNLIEDIIINKGGNVVERQRIDSIILENDFITMSGLVESSKSLEIGKMLGADTIVQGSIIEIRIKENTFKGYGIRRTTRKLIATLRMRVIDIKRGKIVYSKTMEGQVVTTRDNFSHTTYCDEVYDALKSAVEQLEDDKNFEIIVTKN